MTTITNNTPLEYTYNFHQMPQEVIEKSRTMLEKRAAISLSTLNIDQLSRGTSFLEKFALPKRSTKRLKVSF